MVRSFRSDVAPGVALCALLLALAACGQAESDPGPGGVTVGEAQALDAAAQMLDERRVPEAALHPSDEGTALPATSAEASATP
ncbi:hypothetical protein HT136_05390 [Novosphingobium profundi]|uniref:hypothetical protein n=1 Tax=Novosphingobium profundi TaxID=1774954 RepID=UPI001BDA977D|nr:hypothetical protein [Novosphingobium profundi]MBT0667797.1 hypothetical protein [Novosphingobium profundi]